YEGGKTKFLSGEARKRQESSQTAASTQAGASRASQAKLAHQKSGKELTEAQSAAYDRMYGAGAAKETAADKRMRRHIDQQKVLAQSKVANARYDKSTAQRMAATGAVPRAIIQAPGGPAREFVGDQTRVGTYAEGAQMPVAAYQQMAGLHGDVARAYGPSGMDIYNAQAAPGSQALRAQQEALRPGAPGAPGQQLTPGQYQHVQDRMSGYRVPPQPAEGPGGAAISGGDQQVLDQLQQRAGDWGFRWKLVAGPAAGPGAQTMQKAQQDGLMRELEGRIPDQRERSIYLNAMGLGSVAPAGVAFTPGFSGATGQTPMPVAGYNEATMATTGGWQPTFQTPEQEVQSTSARLQAAQDQLMQMAGAGGAGGGWSITGTRDPNQTLRDAQITALKAGTETKTITNEMLRTQGLPLSPEDAATAKSVTDDVQVLNPQPGVDEPYSTWNVRINQTAARVQAAMATARTPQARRATALALLAKLTGWRDFLSRAQRGEVQWPSSAGYSFLGAGIGGASAGALTGEAQRSRAQGTAAMTQLLQLLDTAVQPPRQQPTTQPAAPSGDAPPVPAPPGYSWDPLQKRWVRHGEHIQ
ncbi:MAG TPA: hypothetical protein VFJ30_04080, partial [Phycisphaerae bacterium]|nr:hypothetical protein [Phycisphaerae bacterium]